MTFGDYDYKSNFNKNLGLAIIIGVVATLLAGAFSQLWVYSLLIGICIAIFYQFKSMRWHRNYILEINAVEEICVIKYLEKGTEKTIKADKANFRCVRKRVIDDAGTPFLILSNSKHNFMIRQYEIGQWSESNMNDVVKFFESHP